MRRIYVIIHSINTRPNYKKKTLIILKGANPYKVEQQIKNGHITLHKILVIATSRCPRLIESYIFAITSHHGLIKS